MARSDDDLRLLLADLESDYRNPVLAEAMRNLGYVQRFGAGLQIARSAVARNGNPPIEFTVEPSFIGVTLRRAP